MSNITRKQKKKKAPIHINQDTMNTDNLTSVDSINNSKNDTDNLPSTDSKEENKTFIKLPSRYIGKLIDSKLLPRTEEGLPCCRWCNKGVNPPRRTLCSKECEHELKLRISGRYLRDCVYKRDNAICAICNIDTKLLALNAILLKGDERDAYLKEYKISLKRKIWIRRHGGGLWDADHIVPVKDGGGCSSLENMRTLCISCHKIITFKK